VLSRLLALSRPLDGLPDTWALAIYADDAGTTFGARETGEEGVACVDDVARAVVLWCDLWERTKLPVARAWAERLLAFCRHAQQADGRFLNFILDWNGALNVEGATSRADGASFWHARGARAMAKAWRTFGDTDARERYERARAWTDERPAGSDVRAIQVLAALDAGDDLATVLRWCDDIASQRRGDILVDAPDAERPHLWGHIQEGVLALAATALGRPDLLATAVRSAEAYLLPIVSGGFALPTVQPYGVASAVFSLDRLRAATGEQRYADAARDARAWFDGRNPAGRPVYDRVAGRVADGIDGDRLNPHSGAESNLLGAQALLDDVAAWVLRHPDACFPSAPSSRSSDASSAAS
jgi:hypothetical protein